MTTSATDPAVFLADIQRIGREVAAAHAEDVDREGRFPAESIDALREVGALSAFVPAEMGGAGFDIHVLARACRELGRSCSSTAMVFAMHHLQVANIARHVEADSWHGDYMRRLSAEQRLIASCTSEKGTGGDMARSVAAVETAADGTRSFVKEAPTCSYPEYADDLLTTVRRSPEADGADQVIVLTSRAQTELTPRGVWDTLGMRGTCSPPFTIRATFDAEQILDVPFHTMMAESIVPVSHILWANVWLGMAIEAFERGRTVVRQSAIGRDPNEPAPAARKLSEVLLDLRMVRAEVDSAAADFERWDADGRTELESFTAGLRFNTLKLAVSERVPEICLSVMGLIGIRGYMNNSSVSIGRLLRDSLSGQVMISNERIHTTNAGLIPLAKEG